MLHVAIKCQATLTAAAKRKQQQQQQFGLHRGAAAPAAAAAGCWARNNFWRTVSRLGVQIKCRFLVTQLAAVGRPFGECENNMARPQATVLQRTPPQPVSQSAGQTECRLGAKGDGL